MQRYSGPTKAQGARGGAVISLKPPEGVAMRFASDSVIAPFCLSGLHTTNSPEVISVVKHEFVDMLRPMEVIIH